MTKHRYNKDEVLAAIQQSRSIREVLINLNVSAKGGQYKIFYRYIKDNDIDISDLKGNAWAKGTIRENQRKDVSYYLENQTSISSFRLKNKLIEEEILAPTCVCCGGTEWLNKPIPLELDHIDGNHQNNSIDNLRLLCPNCHAQTDTYRGKNQRRSGARGGNRTPKG